MLNRIRTKTRLYIWQSDKNSKYGHIAISTHSTDDSQVIYASFWPTEQISAINIFQHVKAKLIKTYDDDIEAMNDQPADSIIEIDDLDIEAIHEEYENMEAYFENTRYFFLPTLSFYGLNCSSFVHRLLIAGNADISRSAPFSIEKQRNVAYFIDFLLEGMISFYEHFPEVHHGETAIFSRTTAIAFALWYRFAIISLFSKLWRENLAYRLFDSPGAKHQYLSNYYQAYCAFLYCSGISETLSRFSNNEVPFVYPMMKIIAPLIYLLYVSFYQKTLSPNDILEILLDNVPSKIKITGVQNHENYKNKKIPLDKERILLIFMGMIYAIMEIIDRYSEQDICHISDIIKAALHFLLLTTLTQFVHLNVDASYIFAVVTLPLVTLISTPNYFICSSLSGKLREAAMCFLNSDRHMLLIGAIVILKYLYLHYSKKNEYSETRERYSVFSQKNMAFLSMAFVEIFYQAIEDEKDITLDIFLTNIIANLLLHTLLISPAIFSFAINSNISTAINHESEGTRNDSIEITSKKELFTRKNIIIGATVIAATLPILVYRNEIPYERIKKRHWQPFISSWFF